MGKSKMQMIYEEAYDAIDAVKDKDSLIPDILQDMEINQVWFEIYKIKEKYNHRVPSLQTIAIASAFYAHHVGASKKEAHYNSIGGYKLADLASIIAI